MNQKITPLTFQIRLLRALFILYQDTNHPSQNYGKEKRWNYTIINKCDMLQNKYIVIIGGM
jgi:hypothetical protein